MSEIRSVAVVGAGTMGNGIAQVCAVAGMKVSLRDVSTDALAPMAPSLAKLVEKGKLSAEDRELAIGRIRTTTGLPEAVEGADLIVEAIPERMDWKLELFTELGRITKPDALLGTNTSSLSVTEIAGASGAPERVVGMHFFNPVPLMQLLEIVRGLRASDGAIERARSFAKAIGKEPIVVKDSPGFATSRLGVILGVEAIRMLETGVASAEDIDKAMELGYRHPMGPLKLGDLVGLDVRLAILEHLHEELGEQFRPPSLLRQMVRAGKLGRKTGEGFYKY
ncbi:MAG: 3-hydroxybutyryl-CoA dehydrogenase [Sandaracinaceae bacterium]|nr:3-hydroxybutyryl-CoA dehydrogenase [Sandaracinaceae bacterium]